VFVWRKTTRIERQSVLYERLIKLSLRPSRSSVKGIEHLKSAFPTRKFTIDGRLVGDIGEIIAELEYDVALDRISRRGHDGCTSAGRNVQVKATFKDSLTFGIIPDYYLGFKLYDSGEYEEIFNGPVP
jgi:uncharacterized protein DUF6998